MPRKKPADGGLPRQYKIIVENEFQCALDEIFVYISANWWEASVENFRAAVRQKLNSLNIFPNGYRKWRDSDYRYCLVWDYLIYFKVDDELGEVRVLWIMHAVQDLDKLLNEKDRK